MGWPSSNIWVEEKPVYTDWPSASSVTSLLLKPRLSTVFHWKSRVRTLVELISTSRPLFEMVPMLSHALE